MRLKKILLMICIAVLATLFSGCANITCKLNLKEDGKVDVNASVLYSDKEFSYDNKVIEKIKKEFSDKGYIVKDAEENGLKGFSVEKEDFRINELNETLKNEFNLQINSDTLDDLKFEKGFLYNKYDLDADIDLTSFSNIGSLTDGSGNVIAGEELQKLLSHLSLKFVIELDKGTVMETNSLMLSEDKKTVEWVLIPGTKSEIELEAITTAVLPIVGTLVILGVILLLTVILLILFTRMYIKRRKECNK